jgi:hypothetical protein
MAPDKRRPEEELNGFFTIESTKLLDSQGILVLSC